MVEDNPRMNELEELIEFCKKYDKIYIYDHDIVQRMISKYLYMSEIQIQGFIKPETRECDKINEPFPVLNLTEAKQLRQKRKIGIIVSNEDHMYNQTIGLLKMIGIHHIFIVSEWNKRTFCKKMLPRSIDDFYLEVNLADHCNLNCQCCDHFSPIATKTFIDFDQYSKDIKHLASLTNGKIGLMKLQGGEPLLNPDVIEFMRITRECFPDSPICLFTDGLLLPKWGKNTGDKNIWKAVAKYEIEVRMTQYPISFNLEQIISQATEHGIPVTFDPPQFKKGARLWIFSEIGSLSYKGIKHSVKHPFDLSGKQEKFRFISCYQFNESIVLRDGKIYTCPMIPYAHYFNAYFNQDLKLTENCYIDIYKVSNFQEISEFCTHRTSFCDYCAVHKRFSRPWKQSEHSIEEWVL